VGTTATVGAVGLLLSATPKRAQPASQTQSLFQPATTEQRSVGINKPLVVILVCGAGLLALMFFLAASDKSDMKVIPEEPATVAIKDAAPPSQLSPQEQRLAELREQRKGLEDDAYLVIENEKYLFKKQLEFQDDPERRRGWLNLLDQEHEKLKGIEEQEKQLDAEIKAMAPPAQQQPEPASQSPESVQRSTPVETLSSNNDAVTPPAVAMSGNPPQANTSSFPLPPSVNTPSTPTACSDPVILYRPPPPDDRRGPPAYLVVTATIDETGRAKDISFPSPPDFARGTSPPVAEAWTPEYEKMVIDDMAQWKVQPSSCNGSPASKRATFYYSFHFRR